MSRMTPIVFFAVMIAGCGLRSDFNSAGLKNIAQLNAHQKELGRYVDAQTKNFRHLRSDINAPAWQAGIGRADILARYGEPVADVAATASSEEVFIYRHPVEFFTLPFIYLYFDSSSRLVSWSVME